MQANAKAVTGGSGTMVGTLIGVFIMSTLKTGLASMGLQPHWQTFAAYCQIYARLFNARLDDK